MSRSIVLDKWLTGSRSPKTLIFHYACGLTQKPREMREQGMTIDAETASRLSLSSGNMSLGASNIGSI
jgi:hypothetical protein